MNLQVEPKNAIRNCIPGHKSMSGNIEELLVTSY